MYNDFKGLAAGKWLNDTIIDLFYSLMDYQEDIYSLQDCKTKSNAGSSETKSTKGSIASKIQTTECSSEIASVNTEVPRKKKVPSKCLFMRTAFMTSLLNINKGQIGGYEYSRVSRWTEDVDIFFYDQIFIPCNVRSNHWICFGIFLEEQTIEVFDSQPEEKESYGTHLKLLLLYLSDEHYHRKGKPLKESWKLYNNSPKNIFRQDNYHDCGVYTCIYADIWSRRGRDPNTYTACDSTTYRKHMALQIVKGNLPTKPVARRSSRRVPVVIDLTKNSRVNITTMDGQKYKKIVNYPSFPRLKKLQENGNIWEAIAVESTQHIPPDDLLQVKRQMQTACRKGFSNMPIQLNGSDVSDNHSKVQSVTGIEIDDGNGRQDGSDIDTGLDNMGAISNNGPKKENE